MMGASSDELGLPKYEARLTEEVKNNSDRPHYVRGWVHDGQFTAVGRQESHALFGLSRANAVMRVPAGKTFSTGATVAVIPLD